MSTYPYAAPAGHNAYGGAPAASPYQTPAQGYGAPPPASHSPYGAPAPAPGAYPAHSPYAAPAPAPGGYGSPQLAQSAYATSTLSPTSLGGGGYHSAAPSPRMGTMGLAGSGATTMTTPLMSGGQLTVGPGAMSPPQQAQPFASNVQPGTVTYTTTVDEKGRTVYHHFRAESATYTSPQGMTYTGIQWMPIETSFHPQVGVAPAGPDIAAAVRPLLPQGHSPVTSYREEKSYKEIEKEEKRRRKEERKTAERNTAWEAERRARERAEEEEILKARERDSMREPDRRSRRLSMGAGLGADLNAPTGYGRERSRARGASRERDTIRERELRERVAELEGRMSDMSVGGRGGLTATDPYSAPPVGTRSRRNSTVVSPYDEPVGAGAYDRDYERERDPYATRQSRPSSIYGGVDTQNKRRSGIYAAPNSGVGGGIYAMPNPERSPRYGGAGGLPPSASAGGSGFYPPGHIYEGHPIPAGTPASPSLLPGAPYGMGAPSPRMRAGAMPAVSPRMGGTAALAGGYGAPPAQDQLLASPDAFSRPINRAQAFTPFSILRVNDLDDFLDDQIAARPAVLGTHDVLPEDWGRFMNDVALAWKGRLPLPAFAGGPAPVRSDLVVDLLDLWNQQFFLPRNTEIALYRGRHCLSGRQEGGKLPEALVPSFEDLEYSSGSSDEDSGLDRQGPGGYGYSGRGGAYEREAKRKAKMEEKVRRAMERKEDFKKGYALYLHYVPPRDY